MIAAPQGRSGKTTVAIGLCAALRQKGLKVKPFKKGPDYIDPSWLSAAAGRACTNLDPFLCENATLLKGFHDTCVDADLALVEASMGLYDSSSEDGVGSSAWLARQLDMPIVLVVNASRMTRSVAAMVKGYMDFEPGTRIAGVILNNVAGVRHVDTVVRALEHHCGIPVLGALPKDSSLNIKERHLGIVPLKEQFEAEEMIERICSIFKNHADIDKIIEIARSAPEISDHPRGNSYEQRPIARVGVMADKSFTFYYPENLEAMKKAGAELIYIKATEDKHLPGISALYIGGGFPELYAGELEANSSLRKEIADAAEAGMPVYAECAGLMYLCRSIIKDGRPYKMCGVIPADVQIEEKPQGHGYVVAEVVSGNPIFERGQILKGHEFHHSRLINAEGLNFAYRIMRGHGVDGQHDGIVHKNVFASYVHLHAWGVPSWASNFVELAAARPRINRVTV
jgi:cobyrinic acid a,c-diamide synthase